MEKQSSLGTSRRAVWRPTQVHSCTGECVRLLRGEFGFTLDLIYKYSIDVVYKYLIDVVYKYSLDVGYKCSLVLVYKYR